MPFRNHGVIPRHVTSPHLQTSKKNQCFCSTIYPPSFNPVPLIIERYRIIIYSQGSLFTEIFYVFSLKVIKFVKENKKNTGDLLPNSLYRAGRFANSWGILDFSVPSIIWVGAGLCKSQHNALANCFARLRFLRDGREKPSNRHYIKLKNFALLPEATSFCGQRGCWKRGN